MSTSKQVGGSDKASVSAETEMQLGAVNTGLNVEFSEDLYVLSLYSLLLMTHLS